MVATSRFGRQVEEIVATLNRLGVPFALIGGLALASHKAIRATSDIDLLTDGAKAEEIDRELSLLGYRCIHRSTDAASLNMTEVREYFRLFNREKLLDDILNGKA